MASLVTDVKCAAGLHGSPFMESKHLLAPESFRRHHAWPVPVFQVILMSQEREREAQEMQEKVTPPLTICLLQSIAWQAMGRSSLMDARPCSNSMPQLSPQKQDSLVVFDALRMTMVAMCQASSNSEEHDGPLVTHGEPQQVTVPEMTAP